ncbi:hypothetical protein [Psychromicrobium lacuslunae]|uniref:Uncharacterized protein n=1 Tax=Psychromicrobium lacuslunae TaxID=1618207 RepID=A0A0D4C0C1_9MICC|nr:hypothetical protein [Psychromicrobium lacuslunae]AJT42018.1 hypothetical protein UM93_11770 [Psychromicrobium lacuslunae]
MGTSLNRDLRVEYMERWNTGISSASKQLKEEAVQLSYETGKGVRQGWFTAAIFENIETNNQPRCFLEIRSTREFFKVFFLNRLGTITQIFSFKSVDNKLFMLQLMDYTYSDETRRYDKMKPNW